MRQDAIKTKTKMRKKEDKKKKRAQHRVIEFILESAFTQKSQMFDYLHVLYWRYNTINSMCDKSHVAGSGQQIHNRLGFQGFCRH